MQAIHEPEVKTILNFMLHDALYARPKRQWTVEERAYVSAATFCFPFDSGGMISLNELEF